MKKLVILPIIVLLALVCKQYIYAQTPGEKLTQAALRVTNAAERQSAELTRIQQKADNMISERLDSLNRLLSRIQGDSKLNDTDKTNLTNDVQTTIAALQSLKTKIDTDTDVPTARADTKTIVTSYHVFAIFEPKTRILVIIDNLTTLTNFIQTLEGKVQTLVNTQKANGTDTTAMQKSLDDITAKLTDISTRLANDKTTLGNVSVTEDIPTAQKIFAQIRQDLAVVRQDFAAIRADFASLREDFRINLKTGNVSPRPTNASGSAK